MLIETLHTNEHNELLLMRLALERYSGKKTTRAKVVVVGGFGSGKSSFLNYLVGQNIFPVGCLPTTAVPTSLFCRNDIDKVNVFCEDKNGVTFNLDEDILHRFSYNNLNEMDLQMKSAMSRLIVDVPHKDYQNIEFIDTPGLFYTDEDEGTDIQIRGANVMIYLVNSYTMPTAEAWNLIDAFSKNPVLLILTKSDMLSPEMASEVFNYVLSLARTHENIHSVLSMSVYENDTYSTDRASLSDIINQMVYSKYK